MRMLIDARMAQRMMENQQRLAASLGIRPRAAAPVPKKAPAKTLAAAKKPTPRLNALRRRLAEAQRQG